MNEEKKKLDISGLEKIRKTISDLTKGVSIPNFSKEWQKQRLEMDKVMKEIYTIKKGKEIDEILDRKTLVDYSKQTTKLLTILIEFIKHNTEFVASMSSSTKLMGKVVRWTLYVALCSLLIAIVSLAISLLAK